LKACIEKSPGSLAKGLAILLVLGCFSLSGCALQANASIRGVVTDENGLVSGASVRIQGKAQAVETGPEGNFTLDNLPRGVAVTLSAWKQGYYCTKTETIRPPAKNVILRLREYQVNDNPEYTWIPPTGDNSCYSCKPGVTQVWLANDAHSRSSVNPRFLSMYNGTDTLGNQSPLTRIGFSSDYGAFPLRPDPKQPYFGPGYKLDFPKTAGNCSACHVPGAALADPYGMDPNEASGVDLFGVHCDFCHKINAVRLNPANGMPFPNLPGVLSIEIRRPFTEDKERYQLFFGSFQDDNVPEEDTYLPLIEESQFCAACHFGVFWDTVVYNSFGEWLASPYSEPASGKTCQQCHMPAPTLLDGQTISNVAPGKGGIERDPNNIHAHTFPGASNVELLQNAVSMESTASLSGGHLVVRVTITNDKTGHHVPTDSPLRQLILLVKASGDQGQALSLLEGSTVPEWGGVGDPQADYYAGLPGKAYAKILEEVWTNITPSGAYWNPTRILSDNRLAAFSRDTTEYIFEAPAGENISIEVTLLYRRAFIELIEQKKWDAPDNIMEQNSITVPAHE
jgi:hypothetical protein